MVSEEDSMSGRPLRILVVCAGNTCRSPAAAAAIRASAQRRYITIDVESVGTNVVPETPATDTMVGLAARFGMTISGKSRQVNRQDLERADIALALDRSVEDVLNAMACTRRPVIGLLGAYAMPESDAEIADPWGGTERDYARTLEQIMIAADAFVASLNG